MEYHKKEFRPRCRSVNSHGRTHSPREGIRISKYRLHSAEQRIFSIFSLSIVLCTVFFFFCGCPIGTGDGSGGGDSGSDPDPPVSSEPLYEETNAAIADASDAVGQNLPAMGIAQAMEAAARAIAVHECVKSAACVTEENRDPCLLVEFTNGILYLMHVVRMDGDGLDSTEPEGNAIPAVSLNKSLGARSINLPAATQAVFFDLPEFKTDVDKWIHLAEDAGYNCRCMSEWRVEDFQNLDAYGLVYVSTHGYIFGYYDDIYFMFCAPHRRNTVDDLEYIRNGDFKDHAVMLTNRIYIAEDEDPFMNEDIEYAVTHKYIDKYSGSFPDGSLFFADACFSATPDKFEFRKPLIDTLLAQNVGTVLGWSWEVRSDYAVRASNFILGQMLANLDGLKFIDFSGPPIRPYSLQDAFTALQHKAWQYDDKNTELQLFGDGELVLRPAIRQLIVDVDPELGTEELKLLGNFGERPGSLTLCESPANLDGGNSLSWSVWEDNTVIAQLDADSCGYVAAKVAGVPSNAHPLSRWELDMNVNGTVPRVQGPRISLAIDASWRAEIVAERGLITSGTTVPATGWSDPIPESGRASTLFSLESSCDYNFTGIFEDENYIYEYPEGANEGSMPVSLNDTDMFFGTVTLWPDQSTAMFQIVLSRDAYVLKTDKKNPEAGPQPDQILVTVQLIFMTDMDKEGRISGGEEIMPYEYSWPDIVPEAPPLPETAR